MRLFLARTDTPEVMMEKFRKDPLVFLYHQEDRTDYRIKTISYLIDEIQNMPEKKELYQNLSRAGKRRYTAILHQLQYMVENG